MPAGYKFVNRSVTKKKINVKSQPYSPDSGLPLEYTSSFSGTCSENGNPAWMADSLTAIPTSLCVHGNNRSSDVWA